MAWLLAKTWVRSSDFQLHQLQSHLLRGHLIAEVIAVATMRSLPSLHPIYKVLQHLCHSVFDCPSYFRLLHGVSPCTFQSSSNQFICGDTYTHTNTHTQYYGNTQAHTYYDVGGKVRIGFAKELKFGLRRFPGGQVRDGTL